MTDQDRLLALGAPHYIDWLTELRGKRVSEMTALFREGKETRNKQAEIMVYSDLISALEAKLRNQKHNKGAPA